MTPYHVYRAGGAGSKPLPGGLSFSLKGRRALYGAVIVTQPPQQAYGRQNPLKRRLALENGYRSRVTAETFDSVSRRPMYAPHQFGNQLNGLAESLR